MRARGAVVLVLLASLVASGCSSGDAVTSATSTSTSVPAGSATVAPSSVAVSSTAPPTTADAGVTDDEVVTAVAALAPARLDDVAPAAFPLTVGGEPLPADQAAAFAALMADLLDQARATAAGTPAGFRRAAPAAGGSPSLGSLGLAVVGIGDVVATVGNGAPVRATTSTTQSTAEATGSVSGGVNASVDAAGRRSAELSLEMEVTTTDGSSASAKVRGKVTGPPCPDATGLLELEVEGELTVTARSGTATAQSRHVFRGKATLVFGDDGGVATLETDIDVESNDTRPDGRAVFIETRGGITSSNPYGGGTATAKDVQLVRRSQDATLDQRDIDMATQGRELAATFVTGVVIARRDAVQNGGCVVVDVTGPTSVGASAAVTPRVAVRHKLEGTELDTRAEVTLSGKGILSTESLANTPGDLQYTSGEEAGDSGTITVVSRSRRGIGTGSITVKVTPSYRVEASNIGVLSMSGVVCSLDQPFDVAVSGGRLDGTITFSPPSAGSGTYSGSGTILTWSGGYTVTGLDTTTPVLTVDEGTTTIQNVGEAPSFWEGGFTLTLVPDATACA